MRIPTLRDFTLDTKATAEKDFELCSMKSVCGRAGERGLT